MQIQPPTMPQAAPAARKRSTGRPRDNHSAGAIPAAITSRATPTSSTMKMARVIPGAPGWSVAVHPPLLDPAPVAIMRFRVDGVVDVASVLDVAVVVHPRVGVGLMHGEVGWLLGDLGLLPLGAGGGRRGDAGQRHAAVLACESSIYLVLAQVS